VPSLALLLGFWLANGAWAAEEPDLKTIAESLQRWRSSFTNVRIVWEYWNPELLKDKDAVRPSPDDVRYSRAEWTWSDVGAARHEFWAYYQGEVILHQVSGRDGRKLAGFRATYSENGDKPGFLRRLELHQMQSPQPTTPYYVAPLAYVYRAESPKWLGGVLAEGRAVLEGYEEVGDTRCARVSNDGLLLWLDPARDFLPRRVCDARFSGEEGRVFEAEEFQRIGPGIWFPKRGWHRRTVDPVDERTRWLVTEAVVNQPLDPKLFEAPAPSPGTGVVGGSLGTWAAYGERRPGEARERQIAEQAQRNASAMGTPISSRTLRSEMLWWAAYLLGASLAVLGVGVWMLRLRRLW
jgi:hypothetical protein